MARTNVIKEAYRRLGDVTPMTTDCGKLCQGVCCNGDDNAGMWVFPGEEALLAGFTLTKNETNTVAVCDGTCDRDRRPLSCRIFPLFPMVTVSKRTGKLRIKAMPDPRALRVCPLFREGNEITPAFTRRVERVGKTLCKDPALRDFLIETTDFLTYLYTVKEKLG